MVGSHNEQLNLYIEVQRQNKRCIEIGKRTEW